MRPTSGLPSTSIEDLQQLLGHVRDAGVVGLDPEGRVTYWNSGAEKLFGWRPEEVRGRDEGFLYQDGEEAEERKETASLGSAFHEGWCLRKGGSRFWGSKVLMQLTDEAGTAAGFVKIVRDVSPGRQVLAGLEHFTRLADQANEALVVVGPDGELVYANRVLEALLGYPEGELLGLSLFHLQQGRDEAGIARWLEASRTHPSVPYRTTLLRKDGSPLDVEVTAAGKRYSAEAFHLLVIRGSDARARREAEASDRRRLESLELLAGGIAHDFNNLLTAAVNYAELAMDEAAGGSAQESHLERLRGILARFSGLTRKMLDYSGRGGLARERVDLNLAADHLRGRLDAAGARGAQVVLDLDPTLPTVEADPLQVDEILVNVALNALEAGDGKGPVTVRTGHGADGWPGTSRMVPAHPGRSGAWAWVEVQDAGPGMTAEALDRLFDPFYSTKAPGRGLGLPVVHGIVKAHGGDIQIETGPGKGTTFRVLFPA